MSRQRLIDNAGEYVLGTLDAAECAEIERAAESDAEVRAAIGFWETTFADLTPAEEVEPPAALWQAIEARLDASPPGTFSVRAGDGEWVTVLPGVDKKLLFADEDEGVQSFLLRLAPGAVVPAHEHPRTEECVVLEGDLRMGDAVLLAGEYHAAPAGVPHPPLTTVGGAVIFLRGAL